MQFCKNIKNGLFQIFLLFICYISCKNPFKTNQKQKTQYPPQNIKTYTFVNFY